MSLEITRRSVEGIEILDLAGHLSLGQEDLDFRRENDRLLKAGNVRAALNFSGLRELDTTGLGTVLLALAEFRKAGRESGSLQSAAGSPGIADGCAVGNGARVVHGRT